MYGPYLYNGRRIVRVGKKTISYARYLMEKHLGRKLERWEAVHHINGDATDDRIENLEVMHKSLHNMFHAYGQQNTVGSKNGSSKLTAEIVLEIRKLWAIGKINQQELAAQFKCSDKTISDVCRRNSWTHI